MDWVGMCVRSCGDSRPVWEISPSGVTIFTNQIPIARTISCNPCWKRVVVNKESQRRPQPDVSGSAHSIRAKGDTMMKKLMSMIRITNCPRTRSNMMRKAFIRKTPIRMNPKLAKRTIQPAIGTSPATIENAEAANNAVRSCPTISIMSAGVTSIPAAMYREMASATSISRLHHQ